MNQSAKSFFAQRRLTPRIWSEGTLVWVDLVNAASGAMVAPQYGRGSSEEDALSSAVARYRVEEADWDQSGIRVAIEFVPTFNSEPSVHQIVTTAFLCEGIQVEDFVRPAFYLEAELQHPDLKWASPSLRVHVVSDLAVEEMIRNVGTPIGLALASVRKGLSALSFSVLLERPDRKIWLAWKHDDNPDEIPRAMAALPQDLEARSVLGWDKRLGAWIDL
jgi:hypothetical protein